MRKEILFGLVLTTTLVAAPALRAEEKSLKEAQVPKAVVEAVAKKYPDARKKTYSTEDEEGKSIYEVEMTAGKKKVSVDVSPEGKILAEETTVDPGALPGPVKTGLQSSRYKGWKIAKAERVVTDENESAPSYEVVVRSGSHKMEVQLDEQGKITKEEPKKPGDND